MKIKINKFPFFWAIFFMAPNAHAAYWLTYRSYNSNKQLDCEMRFLSSRSRKYIIGAKIIGPKKTLSQPNIHFVKTMNDGHISFSSVTLSPDYGKTYTDGVIPLKYFQTSNLVTLHNRNLWAKDVIHFDPISSNSHDTLLHSPEVVVLRNFNFKSRVRFKTAEVECKNPLYFVEEREIYGYGGDD